MLIYRCLLLLKFVGVVLYGGGLVGALASTDAKDRKRAVHAIASPGLGVTWTAGYLLTLQLNLSLGEPWIVGGLALSLVSQLALVAMATREERTVAGALWAAVPFLLVLGLMVFRPRWPGGDMSALRQLRWVAFLEGLSFLALLFIAMPVKYLLGLPVAVRVAGSVHGLLFLCFVSSLFRAAAEHGWPKRRALAAFGASLVPFGTFVLDRALQREERGGATAAGTTPRKG